MNSFRLMAPRPHGDHPHVCGRTANKMHARMILADHPHACGENIGTASNHPFQIGPSPRVWGEPDRGQPWRRCDRTIPTRVGRTNYSRSQPLPNADHPHACGENNRCLGSSSPSRGPSPRVWGERAYRHDKRPATRTIPTRVGRTCRR